MKSSDITSISQGIIRFPEIKLHTRDAHKLRGYFGNFFRENSPLLHNHYESGEFRNRYPLVQYKVLNGTPTLVALDEGSELLIHLFLKINKLQIGEDLIEVRSKNISSLKAEIGYLDELKEYTFETLWMALNQANYKKYRELEPSDQSTMMNKILVGNVLSFYKQMNYFLGPDQRLLSKTQLKVKTTQFKGQKMMAFQGGFLINAKLPDYIGIGKAVSRGFGTIKAKNHADFY